MTSRQTRSTPVRLPPARGEVYRIGLVCLGNICRSPMAEAVLRDRLDRAGLGAIVQIESSGTGDWHVGHPMDRRAAATLDGSGYDGSTHRAQQITSHWFDQHDLLLTMDEANLRDVLELAPDDTAADRVRMFRDFDPRAAVGDREVPDPYYGDEDGFGLVLAIIERTADELVDRLRTHLRPQG